MPEVREGGVFGVAVRVAGGGNGRLMLGSDGRHGHEDWDIGEAGVTTDEGGVVVGCWGDLEIIQVCPTTEDFVDIFLEIAIHSRGANRPMERLSLCLAGRMRGVAYMAITAWWRLGVRLSYLSLGEVKEVNVHAGV